MADRPDLGVLGEIAARKRVDVAARLAGQNLESLRARAAPTALSLRLALARPGARFILEVKRASPSQGILRRAADPAAVARAYRGAADAISVLTDEPYFGGSLGDLQAVRAAFDGPILAKDFIVDPRQVPEARIHGADAVLAILALLSDEEARALMAEAERLGMAVLVETHDEAEVRRAIALGAAIVGLNNRDLKSLAVDLAVTERLASLVPADRLVVAESGIASRADVERLAPHADAFLVGSALMRAPDPGLAARALAFGRIKICGLTDSGDARLAEESGASFAGLILVPGTRRAIGLGQAEAIAGTLSIPAVGVFRNAPMTEIAEAARVLGLAAVQLHGEEDEAFLKGLRPILPAGVAIWAAAAVGTEAPQPRHGADRTLYDAGTGAGSGGTGRTFDWSLLAGRDLSNAIVAGGLAPQNIAAAARLGAWGLDVGSGVEAAPGRKDPALLAALFEALRPPVRGESRC
jgi:indole-3-glycerol phosphate synthase/phosphoribosylanthranilate isomerase